MPEMTATVPWIDPAALPDVGFVREEPADYNRTQPRLLDRLRAAIRARHYSRRTEDAYVGWARRFILANNKRHPRDMGHTEVTQFLTDLAVQHNVSASTQNQALAALLFLYQNLLQQPVPWLGSVVRAKRSRRIPVVMTR